MGPGVTLDVSSYGPFHGRHGIQDLVRGTVMLARRMARHLASQPGVHVLNEVVLNQVLVGFDGPGEDADHLTREVIGRVQQEGTCWVGGAVWKGLQVMRISVSNWSTTTADIDRSAEAIIRCFRGAQQGL